MSIKKVYMSSAYSGVHVASSITLDEMYQSGQVERKAVVLGKQQYTIILS